MKSKLIGLLLVLPLVGAEPAGYKYWSAAQLNSVAKSLSNKTDATSLQNLGKFGVDRALAVHRTVSGMAELHEKDADLIVVIAGTGTLIVGGTMPSSKVTEKDEVRGPSIDGGAPQKIAPGDILHIPAKTPHQIRLEPGTQITYFTLKARE
jgi:mannose-6-phosphate isomerase-like protein (cupin superfamily)